MGEIHATVGGIVIGGIKMKIVHIQSVLPWEDVIALKEKTGESTIKEAISKAVYHYLQCKSVKSIKPQTLFTQKD